MQRDFGLYLVSLFDTYYASAALQFPSRSLAYLLLKYAKVEADKKYQLADWRIRPLPTEMLAYARADTHYLLYIYDQLRRDLLTQSKISERDLMADILDASRKGAMVAYRRERYDFEEGIGEGGWRKLLLNNRGPKLHSNLQLTVFKRLHRWRDQIAREEDESVNYVLPNRSLLNLAASLPHNMQSVVAACHPVPPLVQVYAEDIAYIVQKTRKELAEEAANAENVAAQAIQGTVESKKNGMTGSTHIWYKDENAAPHGVRSVIEAIRHGTHFDIWEDQKIKLHSLILQSSKFWEPLHRTYIDSAPIYEAGGELEDIKLSVPLPPLTAQIYMTAEDIKALEVKEDSEDKGDNISALADHPFVQRSLEKQDKSRAGAEIIVARQLGKKEKKREREGHDEEGTTMNDETISISSGDKPIRTASRSKKRKGLKEPSIETTNSSSVEQFDPYKIEEYPKPMPNLGHKGQTPGKSMTFVTQRR